MKGFSLCGNQEAKKGAIEREREETKEGAVDRIPFQGRLQGICFFQ